MLIRAALAMAGAMVIVPAMAGTSDVLVGLDQKVTYDANGAVNGPSGHDAVLVMDISDPAHPRIRGSLPLMNSLLGPPTNLQITRDGKLGLVANSVVATQDGSAWKMTPDNKVYVIDLTANPPKLVDTVAVGQQPSGLAIAHKGDLALVANRAGKSVSVLSIANGKVTALGDVPLEQEASAVVITPDGKRAFVALNLANKVGVLNIDGQKVTYDKTLDIPAAFNPYNLDITPDGRHVIASGTGAGKNNADALTVIEATGPHPHVTGITAPGAGPEGFTIAPNGKLLAAALILGSGAKDSDWFKTKGGELVIMTIGPNGVPSVTGHAPLGRLPEGIVFSPDSEHVYVGNYIDKTLQVFRISNGKPTQVGPAMTLPGQPASMRTLTR
ncbi:beta-propeller fold lactonase family protein [Rhodopila sp.]|uniref:beta-propeller fold lactonase family protein n=1 Tax=Rhodopila sp. TaxID=2480087 RepID=UPI002CB074B2|nr:beta-propeller fold lactonase family protein [Rhodopila sp.]HVZ08044.1 beta-propeller fold lactonase family protein [Rhodopila sp.]